MGVHVSKVRSLTLDTWSSETLKPILLLGGNKKLNAIFEGAKSPSVQRPTADSAASLREKYIRRKYAGREFVPPYNGEDLAKDLVQAILSCDLYQILLLLAQGADIENCKPPPLLTAVQTNEHTLLEFLIMNGADPKAADGQGRTAVHVAAELGYIQPLLLLHKRGASLNVKDCNGLTPVELALRNQNADSVTLLRLAQLSADEASSKDQDYAAFEATFSQALQRFTKDLQSDRPSEATSSRPNSSTAEGPSLPLFPVSPRSAQDSTSPDASRHKHMPPKPLPALPQEDPMAPHVASLRWKRSPSKSIEREIEHKPT